MRRREKTAEAENVRGRVGVEWECWEARGAEKQINRGFKRTEAKDEKREVSSAFVLFPSALALCCVVKYTAIC